METEMEKPRVEEQVVEDRNIGNLQNEISSGQDSETGQASESNEGAQKLKDTNVENKGGGDNKMREIEIEKIVIHCGGTEDKLEKSVKLLESIAEGRKICILQSSKRYPAFGISPGKKAGAKVTIRDKEKIKDLLRRFFEAIENTISKKQIVENQFCFGVHEYIEVPGLEYNRDIGIIGFEVMVVFKRKGRRVKFKKIRRGQIPLKQNVTSGEIEKYLIKNFGLEVGK